MFYRDIPISRSIIGLLPGLASPSYKANPARQSPIIPHLTRRANLAGVLHGGLRPLLFWYTEGVVESGFCSRRGATRTKGWLFYCAGAPGKKGGLGRCPKKERSSGSAVR